MLYRHIVKKEGDLGYTEKFSLDRNNLFIFLYIFSTSYLPHSAVLQLVLSACCYSAVRYITWSAVLYFQRESL